MSAELATAADPRALVPGDPDQLDALAAALGALALGMAEAAGGLRAVGSGDWVGVAGDSFRTTAGEQPGRFDDAGSAFGQAKMAVLLYATTLREAQTAAARAVVRYQDAEQTSATWQNRVGAYRAAEASSERASSASHTTIGVDVVRPPATDPGEADRFAAARILTEARTSVDLAARRTQAILADAERHAPTKPGAWQRFTHGIGGIFDGATHVAEGAVDGVIDMGKGFWSLTGAAASDPHQFMGSWRAMSTLVDVAHPYAMQQAWVGYGRAFVDADEWSTEPGRAFGHTLANVGALAAGGEGAAADAGEAGAAGLAERGSITAIVPRVGEANHFDELPPLEEALAAPHAQGEPWSLSPRQMPAPRGWGDAKTLRRHIDDHARDFPGATTPEAYISQAEQFYLEAVNNKYPTKIHIRNQRPRVRIYDEPTNRFIVMNIDGSIATYFRPEKPIVYWEKLRGDIVEWK